MPPWAMISFVPGFPFDEALELLGDRRQAAAAVDQDRDAALGRDGEDPAEPLVVQVKRLRARMELDAARAEVEAAGRLGDRLGGQVEADERDDDPVARLRGRERAVVRRTEARFAIGLVQAEGEAALDVRPPEVLEQHVERADHPVDVGSDVDVGVEELGPVRSEARGLGLVELDEALGPFPHVRKGHGGESY